MPLLHAADCPLVPKLLGKPGFCDRAACGKPLPPRRRRWCSDECSSAHHRELYGQHEWSAARELALERDGYRCVRCGKKQFDEREPHPSDPEFLGRPYEAYWQEHRFWRRRRAAQQLEVNHIVPRVGAGYGPGCHNHLDNLETLCHPCHVETTNAQRLERMAS